MNTHHHNAQFIRSVLRPLEALTRMLKRYVLLEGLCWSAAVLVAAAMVQFALDRTLVLGLGPRAAILVIVLAVIGYQFYRSVIRPAFARVDVNAVAAVLERKNPGFRDQLVTAVAFATGAGTNPHRDSPAMVAALLDQSSASFRTLPMENMFRKARHRGLLGIGIAAAIIALLVFAMAPDTMATYMARNVLLNDLAWPISTRIDLEGFRNGRLRWPIDDELTLVATALDEVPPALTAEFEFASGDRAVRPMDRRGRNQFLLDFGPLTEAMKVRFLISKFGADERTDWFAVEAVHRPAVRSVRIQVAPPAYADQDAFLLPQGQAGADVIRGSRINLDARLNKPVAKAEVRARSDGRRVTDAVIRNGNRVVAGFVPERKDTFFFDLLDDSGLDNRRPVTFSFRLISDPPPKVRLTLPGAGELVVPSAVLNLEVDCEENLGLKSVELMYQILRESDSEREPPPATAQPLPDFVPKQLRYTWADDWSLLPLSLQPGDSLTLQTRAEDYQPPPIAAGRNDAAAVHNVGESIAYTLKVVTAEELLAELGRREHEWRREFEQIIKAQEQINRRIIELRDSLQDGTLPARSAARYGQEARTQRQQIGRLKTVARQFERILAELRVNQLATPNVRRRLDRGVIQSLKPLIRSDVEVAAESMGQLRREFDDSVADRLERQQTAIVRSMYEILANMLKWEGYNEAVTLLRDVLRLQQNLNKDTQQRLEKEIEKLFGTESMPPPEDLP